MSARRPLALALDLGSTRLKLGALSAQGALEVLESLPAPVARERGLECEFDEGEFDAQVGALLERAAHFEAPLGIACQRSSFVVWDALDLRALTPVISWRDRRAQAWCEANAQAGAAIARRAGLRFSPHYVGPKLAVLAASPLRTTAPDRLRVGTLESFVIARRRPPGEAHVTDVSMAARTLLVDARTLSWSAPALSFFGVSRGALPELAPSCGRQLALAGGPRVSASLSDQAAAFLAVARPGAHELVVNLGTGAFVLRECGGLELREGLLCGPLVARPGAPTRWALEGTINAGAAGLELIGGASREPQAGDEQPELFCAPEAGVGAPHWRAELGPTYSHDQHALAPDRRRRAYLEGLVFRVHELVEALDPARTCAVLLSGGVARDPFVAPALAALLERPLELQDDHEATLLGAARLAAGLEPFAALPRQRVSPRGAHWLQEKRVRWRAWRDAWLAAPRP